MSQKSELVAVLSLGQQGSSVITGTGTNTGLWICIQAVTDTIFSVFTGNNMTGYTGVTFVAGTQIFGPVTAFTLTSGTVIAYNGTVLN